MDSKRFTETVLQRMLSAVFVLLISTLVGAAQTPTATVTGQVKDAGGNVLANVRVVAKNAQTNVERETTTNENGNYTIPLLTIGEYTVTAEKDGFKKAVQQGVVLEVDVRARLDFNLEVGAINDVIEVTAGAAVTATESAAQGTVIENKRIVELPLNSREFYSLALTAPRVLPPAQGSTLAFRGGFNVAGQSEISNNFTLNGIDNNDQGINGPSFRPSIDAIQEFKLLTGSYSAEYGRNSGGQVVVTTKSGTNEFHGTAYNFLRNQVLDARNFFFPANQKIPSFKRNQFGFSVGGPIVKDKTFFFVSYEGLRLREGVTRLASVPFPEMLNGDFRALLRLPTPIRVLNPATGRDFATPNVIDANLIDPIGKALAGFFPAPTIAVTGAPVNNYTFNGNRREDYNQWSLRIDHTFSDRDSLYGTYNFYDNPAFEPSNSLCGGRVVPGFGCTTGLTTQLFGAVWTHSFSPRLINELRVGFNRTRQPRTQEDNDIDFINRFRIPGTFFGGTPNNGGLPQISVAGFATLGGATNLPQDRRDNTYQFVENLIYTAGDHTMKFGADIRRFQLNLYFVSNGRSSFNFINNSPSLTSGYPLADLLLGLPANTTRNPLAPPTYARTTSANLYVQDDWKVKSNFTLNLGLRWEMNTPFRERYDRVANFDDTTGTVFVPGQNGARDALFDNDLNNFSPRVGFAWQPFGNARTVVRGGYGIFYNAQATGNGILGLFFNPPVRNPQTFNASRTTPIRLSDPFPASIAGAGTTTVTAIDKEFKTAMINQWSVSLQRELFGNFLFEVSYLGSHGSSLPLNRNLNQPTAGTGTVAEVNARRPFPRFGNITWVESSAFSNYHSLETKFEKRFSKGLSLLASYTLGKALDNSPGISTGSAASSSTAQNTRNLRGEYGRADFDVRHRFVFTGVYELPFGKGKQFASDGPLSYIVGDWQLATILSLQTGRPFTALLNGSLSNTLNGNNDRPNLVGDPNSGPRTIDRWFNTAAFATPTLGTFGTAGRNIIDGPGFKNIDITVSRRFRITERFGLQFRAEFFNAFNNVNFEQPANTSNVPGFGRITTALNPRQIQFGLKFLF